MKTYFSIKKILQITGFGLVAGVGYHHVNKNIKYKTAINHPGTEFAEMALRTDTRIVSFCGNNFTIKHCEILSNEKNLISIKFFIDGMRGECEALARIEKNTHENYLKIMEEQIKFSKMTTEQKSSSLFTPVDFKDVFIPNKGLLEKLKNITKNEEILNLNFDNDENLAPKISQLIDHEIDSKEEFWRLTSLVLVSSDGILFNVRPIASKYRNYDTEETYYSLRNLKDVFMNICEFKNQYNSIAKKQLSHEEFRTEISQIRQNNMKNRTNLRKKILLVDSLFMVGGFVALRYFMNRTPMNHYSYNLAINCLNKSSMIREAFGKPLAVYTCGGLTIGSSTSYKIYVEGEKAKGHLKIFANDNFKANSLSTIQLLQINIGSLRFDMNEGEIYSSLAMNNDNEYKYEPNKKVNNSPTPGLLRTALFGEETYKEKVKIEKEKEVKKKKPFYKKIWKNESVKA